MSTVLVFADWYLPGYRAGGPIRSIQRLVQAFRDEYHFAIFTRDRDLGDQAPYPDIRCNEWLPSGTGSIYYASPQTQNIRCIRARIGEVQPDILYLNSFFSRFTVRVLILRRAGLLGTTPVVLAPRGEFSPGALQQKARKKRLYLSMARRLRLYEGLLWHMSTAQEAEHVQRQMGAVRYVVASDLPEMGTGVPHALPPRPTKCRGHADFVYLSRIHPMKNLLFLAERLKTVPGDFRMSVFGPIADPDYMAICSSALAELTGTRQWVYGGEVHPEYVVPTLGAYHFFLLPTQGENFGHAIIEALWAGSPPKIRDRTPWKNLAEEGAGWVLPLEDPGSWEQALAECIEMEQEEFARRSDAAVRLARKVATDNALVEANRRLFREALGAIRHP